MKTAFSTTMRQATQLMREQNVIGHSMTLRGPSRTVDHDEGVADLLEVEGVKLRCGCPSARPSRPGQCAIQVPRACRHKCAMRQQKSIQVRQAKPVPGRQPKLDGKKLAWLYKTIASKNPLQLKFQFALWTREMNAELIWKRWRIKLSLASVGRLLAHLGISCQKPLHRAVLNPTRR